ncbi:hypothetical protein BDQ17DRAFT_266109 [Cyathus striatus]|nr:hypothetical protein BDQ17DRAFT_266109 [Cyathus striatus]
MIKLESSTPVKPWKGDRWSTSPERGDRRILGGEQDQDRELGRLSVDTSTSSRTSIGETSPSREYSPSPVTTARLRKRSMNVQERKGLGGIGFGPRSGSSLSARGREYVKSWG